MADHYIDADYDGSAGASDGTITKPWTTPNAAGFSLSGGGGHNIYMAGKIYLDQTKWDLQNNGANGSPNTWQQWAGKTQVEVIAGINLTDMVAAGTHQWTLSAGGTNEYFLELDGGGNPSLVDVKAATVDGHYRGSSADDTDRQRGTVGTLAVDENWAYGNGDGFSTFYIRCDDGDPSSRDIIISQMDYVVDVNWGYHDFNDITFSHGNVSCVLARGIDWNFRRCVFQYADFNGFQTNANRSYTLENCIAYWCGHRAVSIASVTELGSVSADLASGGTLYSTSEVLTDFSGGSGTGLEITVDTQSAGIITAASVTNAGSGYGNETITHNVEAGGSGATFDLRVPTVTVNHFVDYSSHLFCLVSDRSVNAVLTCRNVVSSNGEAGSFDIQNTGATIEFQNCHWYPRMVAAGGALGYINAASYPTTSACDNPPSVATTESTQANLIDPMFTTLSDTSVYDCDFTPVAGSPLINAGAADLAGFGTTDYESVTRHIYSPNVGVIEGYSSGGTIDHFLNGLPMDEDGRLVTTTGS